MHINEVISITDKWLREVIGVRRAKLLSHKLAGEQVFINAFDFLFNIFNQIGLKYIVVNLNDLPEEELIHIPLPALSISYDYVGSLRVIKEVRIIRKQEQFKENKDRYIIIPAKETSKSITGIDSFMGIINLWGKNIEKILLIALFGIGFYFSFLGIFHLTVFGLCFLGLILSQDLLDQQTENNNKNSVVRKICSGGAMNQGNNCNSLSKKSPKLFNYFEWSEIGVSYFWGLIITIFFLGLTPFNGLSNQFMLFFSSAAILFSFFSIYQQVKQQILCRACTFVMLICYGLFGFSIYVYQQNWFPSSSIDSPSILFAVLCTASIFLYSFSRSIGSKRLNVLKGKYSYSKMRLNDFSSNIDLFNKINEERINTSAYAILKKYGSSLQLDAREDKTITIFICTHCVHCMKVLKKIRDQYLNSNIGFRIIHLPVPLNYDTTTVSIQRASKIIAILKKYGIEKYIEIIEYSQEVKADNDLINEKITSDFVLEDGLLMESAKIAETFYQIMEENNIVSYPTFLLGDQYISDVYTIDDLVSHV